MADSAIVTGGTESIGTAICEALSRDGWHVVASDSVPPAGPSASASFVACDVRSRQSIVELVGAARNLGPLRAVVNAHGILRETPMEPLDDKAAEAIIDVNLKGVARVCSAAAEPMAAGASIVNLSSETASMGRAQPLYLPGHEGGCGIPTRSFAVALAPRGIRVNFVAPGYLSEPTRGEGAELQARQGGNTALEAFTPSGRLTTPREVVEVVVLLCSASASGVSGVVLPVDGAQRAY